jgi:hypothetical protein
MRTRMISRNPKIKLNERLQSRIPRLQSMTMISCYHEASLPLFQNLQSSITVLLWAINQPFRSKKRSVKRAKKFSSVERFKKKILLTIMTSEMILTNTIPRMHRSMISLKTVTHSKNRLLILKFTMSVLLKKELFSKMYSEKKLWSPLCSLRSLFLLMTPEKNLPRRSSFRTTILVKMMRFWTMPLLLNKTSPKAKLVVQWTWALLWLTPGLWATTKLRCLLLRPQSLD